MRLERALAESLPASGAGLVAVDVGCGTGHHLRGLVARGFAVAGVDGSAEMLAQARREVPDAELHQAGVEALPFAPDSFDLALCIEVLRYLPDPGPCLAEIARVLRPGGVCITTAAPRFSANGYALVNRLALVAPVAGLVRLKQYFTTPSELQDRFEAAGFTDVEIRAVYSGPINWIERLAPRRLPALLHRWEPLDRRLSEQPMLRGVSNMLLVRAARAS